MMLCSHAFIYTGAAQRYVKCLCKHWAHKFEVEANEQRGVIDFEDSLCVLEATAEGLLVQLRAQENAMFELQEIVIDHLKRFWPKWGAIEVQWFEGSS